MSRAFLLTTSLLALSLFAASQSLAYHQTDPLLAAAHQLEDASRDALRYAERAARHGAFSERRALDELQRLTLRSHRFRRVLRKHGSDSRRTRDAYQHLLLAHHDVRYALAGRPIYPSTRRQLIRVDELMWRLRSRYSARLDRHHDRYGRHGHASVYRYLGESESDRYGWGRAGVTRGRDGHGYYREPW